MRVATGRSDRKRAERVQEASLFDRFWFAIDDDYSILASEDLREDSPNAKPMREFRGERIRLPS